MKLATALTALVVTASNAHAAGLNKKHLSSRSSQFYSQTTKNVATGWFTGFHIETFPISDIRWDRYTHLSYSFAVPTAEGGLDLSASNGSFLPAFVGAAKENGVKAMLTIGGWDGSVYFSTSVGSAENRTAFVKTVTDFAQQYELDGVDFDWEYPGNQGVGCNTISPNDTSNFLLFLQELRADATGAALIITTASPLLPWHDASGSPSTDISGFAKVLDWVTIMNYDVYGTWADTAGPNAPLNMTCDVQNTQGSATLGVSSWEAAGLPANQTVLGMAGYGHSYFVNSSAAYDSNHQLLSFPVFASKSYPQGDAWDTISVDACGNQGGYGGTWQYRSLIADGWLNKDGSPAAGIDYTYDECAQSPAIYNATSGIWIAYDDAQSFKAKGEYVKSAGLAGFAMYETGSDYDTVLMDAAHAGAGF